MKGTINKYKILLDTFTEEIFEPCIDGQLVIKRSLRKDFLKMLIGKGTWT
jgi:hypothetical protein